MLDVLSGAIYFEYPKEHNNLQYIGGQNNVLLLSDARVRRYWHERRYLTHI